MSWSKIGVIALGAALLAAQSGTIHRPPTPPKSVRIFVFDCGGMHQGQKQPDLAVPCYLVAHPKGTLLWDAGLIPDKDIKAPPADPAWIVPAHTFAEQLASTATRPRTSHT
jgi:hypothetical protein